MQGVFYRASARHEAERRGITGYARNLKNGSVEVLACGDNKSLEDFRSWLAKGPTSAEVTNVSCESIDCEAAPRFTID